MSIQLGKKLGLWGALLAALTLMLSGCAQAVKVEDIYKKSIDAAKTMNSMHMDMQMKMAMEQGTEKVDVDSDINADVLVKPDTALDMKMKMNMLGQNMDVQMVLNKDGLFAKDPSGNWTKLPKEQADMVLTDSLKESYDPAKQFEMLQQFVTDFKMTETDDAYTLKLEANGDKFKQFLTEEVKKQLSSQQGMGDMTEALKTLKFNAAEYTISIDKKTYNPKDLDAIMDFEITAQGQTMKMKIDLKSAFSKFNEIKEIKTPEGVK